MALTDDQRAMLRLLAQREQGYEDIAALMGLSVEEVRVKVREALAEVGESAQASSETERPEPTAEEPEPPPAPEKEPEPPPALTSEETEAEKPPQKRLWRPPRRHYLGLPPRSLLAGHPSACPQISASSRAAWPAQLP